MKKINNLMMGAAAQTRLLSLLVGLVLDNPGGTTQGVQFDQ